MFADSVGAQEARGAFEPLFADLFLGNRVLDGLVESVGSHLALDGPVQDGASLRLLRRQQFFGNVFRRIGRTRLLIGNVVLRQPAKLTVVIE